MDPLIKAIPKLKRDRVAGWQYIAALIPDKDIQQAISSHIRDIKKLDKLIDSSGSSRTVSLARKRFKSSGRNRKLCSLCKTPTPHVGPAIREHCFRMANKAKANKSWKNFPPGSLARKLRMEKAWAGRRRRKDERILSQTDPRIIKIFGKEQVIKFGRDGRSPAGS